MKIALYTKEDKLSKKVAGQIVDLVLQSGLLIDQDQPDVVIFVGGDGTFLGAVHNYLDNLEHIRFVGVHTGSLGFFCSYAVSEIKGLLIDLKDNKLKHSTHKMLEANIKTKTINKIIFAVNEIRIENAHHTIISEVYIANQLLENYRGNGLLVSSQLGSSGYNKSIGGALIEEGLELLELTEIAPISNSIYRPLSSPLIVSGSKCIRFVGNVGKAIIGFDHLTLKLTGSKYEISVGLSTKTIKLINHKARSYYDKLRNSFITI